MNWSHSSSFNINDTSFFDIVYIFLDFSLSFFVMQYLHKHCMHEKHPFLLDSHSHVNAHDFTIGKHFNTHILPQQYL